jgi:hypothetical protein
MAVASWIVLCALHWNNNGLWYPGDAPRHLANGLLLHDYLEDGLPNPIGYVRSYLVRYPIIVPAKYPPLFYVLEAGAFALIHPSPYVAKGLVLAFALVAALYQVAWLRRFVAPRAGYLGVLLPLLPGVVRYGHSIMLNIPACALQVAALYHTRRWLEDGRPRQLILAAVLALSAVLCYQGACVLLLIAGSWLVMTGRWRWLLDRRALIVVAAAGLPALAGLSIWILSTPERARSLFATAYLTHLALWRWYPIRMPGLFGPLVLALTVLGATLGWLQARWRSEILMSGTWILVTYLFHSYLFAKDERYIIPLAVPLVALAAVGVWSLIAAIEGPLGRAWVRRCTVAALAVVLAVQGWMAWHVPLPEVRGFDAIVATIQRGRQADQEMILVDHGVNSALLTCQVMLDDPEYRLRVLYFDWLLTFAGVQESNGRVLPDCGPRDRQAMARLLGLSGCRWIVAPLHEVPTSRPGTRVLHETLQGASVRFEGTFPVGGPSPMILGLYRQVGLLNSLSDLKQRRAVRSSPMDWLTRSPVMRSGVLVQPK